MAVQDPLGVIKYGDVDFLNLDIYEFVLSKAKLFCVHTDMYKIANIAEAQTGCTYLFIRMD